MKEEEKRDIMNIPADEIYDFEFCENGNLKNGCSRGFPPECSPYGYCIEDWANYKLGLTPYGIAKPLNKDGGAEEDE